MKLKLITAGIIIAANLTACGGSSSSSKNAPDVISLENVGKVLNTNANIALAAYNDSVDTAKDLQAAINTFANNPTQDNLDAAKVAWLVSREPYGQTEVYRFRNSPIDSTDLEGDINAWPLGEALIDYVTTTPSSDFEADQVGVTENGVELNSGGEVDGTDQNINIIAGTMSINADLISNTATAGDEHDVIAGYHAIEFMLWGQDLNDNAQVTVGSDRDQAVKTAGASNLAHGGQRPLADFTSNPNADRRLAYLQVVVTKLIEDLETVRDGWVEGADYHSDFTAVENKAEAVQKLTEILTGMGTLSEGELAGERMQIAFSSNSQEDEHSCFSDNTHRDIWLNAEGVSNSYYGVYAGYDSSLDGVDNETTRAVDGYGIDDYLADSGISSLSGLAGTFEAALTTTETNYMAIDEAARDGSPVDVLIMDVNRNSDNPIYKTIISLNAQSSQIAELAEALEIEDVVVEDDASECDTTQPGTNCG